MCRRANADGKQHRYWSVVENTRVTRGRVVQRHVLYLGEINDTQELAWRRSIEVVEDGAAQPRTLSLFPEERCDGLLADASIVGVRLSELRLRRPRQWGACWLALLLWRELQLDQFWCKRLGVSRKGTRWDQVLFVLVAYRLLAPGSEWRLHREWFQRSALADLLGEGYTSRPAGPINPRPVEHPRNDHRQESRFSLGRKPKMTEHQKREAIRRRDQDGETVREIARSYNVSHSTISRLAG